MCCCTPDCAGTPTEPDREDPMNRRSRGGEATAGRFGPVLIAEFVARFPPKTRFVVAYSGGPDSLALLHAFVLARQSAQARVAGSTAAGMKLGLPAKTEEATVAVAATMEQGVFDGAGQGCGLRLHAVHVDHRLHPDSERWSRRCAEVCRRLAVDLTVLDAGARANAGGRGDEGTARAARYEAFERFLLPGDVLCTAHSEDDHVETVLLNLLRGAGARGLSGIPRERRLGKGIVARPVLGVPRTALRTHARDAGLPLVRDPANEDRRFARVTLRREVMPIIELRWPGARAALGRAAALGRESAELLDALAAIDLEPAGGVYADTLDAATVVALDPARRRNAIAAWLRARGIAAPGVRRIEQIVREVIGAGPEATPCLKLGDVEVRRYRGRVRLVPGDRPAAPKTALRWPIPETLTLDLGHLAWTSCRSGGLDDAIRGAEIVVRFRGGDASQAHGRPNPGGDCRGQAEDVFRAQGRARSLRKRFQQLGIPPWERGRIPLVYVDGVLAAIGSEWINPRLGAGPGASGWRVVWTPRPGTVRGGASSSPRTTKHPTSSRGVGS